MVNRPEKVPSPLSCRLSQVSASACFSSPCSSPASCRSASSREIFSSIRRAAWRSRRAFIPPDALATSTASASARCAGVTAAGSRSADRTITRTWSTPIAPAANATRVAAYLSARSRASHSPPAITARVDPVSRAAHAPVSAAPAAAATARRSASASTASFNATTWDSNPANPTSASPSSPAPSDPTGTPAAVPTAARAAATSPGNTEGRSWVTVMPPPSRQAPTEPHPDPTS